jgi:hypothetical protein
MDKKFRGIDMDDVLKIIRLAEDTELSKITLEIIARYGILHPDWEIVFLSLPKDDPEERERCIHAAAAMLRQEKIDQ